MELRICESLFRRQSEVTRQVVEGISQTHVCITVAQMLIIYNIITMIQDCTEYSWYFVPLESLMALLFKTQLFWQEYDWVHELCPLNSLWIVDQPHANPHWLCGGSGQLLWPVQPAHSGSSETPGQVCTAADWMENEIQVSTLPV